MYWKIFYNVCEWNNNTKCPSSTFKVSLLKLTFAWRPFCWRVRCRHIWDTEQISWFAGGIFDFRLICIKDIYRSYGINICQSPYLQMVHLLINWSAGGTVYLLIIWLAVELRYVWSAILHEAEKFYFISGSFLDKIYWLEHIFVDDLTIRQKK